MNLPFFTSSRLLAQCAYLKDPEQISQSQLRTILKLALKCRKSKIAFALPKATQLAIDAGACVHDRDDNDTTPLYYLLNMVKKYILTFL